MIQQQEVSDWNRDIFRRDIPYSYSVFCLIGSWSSGTCLHPAGVGGSQFTMTHPRTRSS